MKIYTVEEILNKLENCIKYRLPFSHIRFGDGGIKFIHSILFKDFEQLNIIIRKEGLPKEEIVNFFEMWGYYARRADFIDTPEVYSSDKFWPRLRSPKKTITRKTRQRLEMWRTLYYRAEFDNENYCNPESNYLMILRRNKKNLLDLMKNRKVCVITAAPKVGGILRSYGYDVEIVEIVGHYQQQYVRSFENVVRKIKDKANHYDFWLVAAGELGRLYSGLIKENGGRTVDIGFVIEFWMGQDIHPRLLPFMCRSVDNKLELKLKDGGKKYDEFL